MIIIVAEQISFAYSYFSVLPHKKFSNWRVGASQPSCHNHYLLGTQP